MKHSLTNKDKAALTGDCSVCGRSVQIRKAGRGFVCLEARREAKRNWATAHPERARAAKAATRPSTHRLTLRNGEPDTCAICGEVQPVAWGRGWMCPVLHAEKRWPAQAVPDPQCPLCKRYLDRYGACPKCDDDLSDLDTKYMPLEARPMRNFVAQLENIPDFMSVVSTETTLPTESESVVPGWKILGTGPRVTADEWMKRNGHSW